MVVTAKMMQMMLIMVCLFMMILVLSIGGVPDTCAIWNPCFYLFLVFVIVVAFVEPYADCDGYPAGDEC